MSLCANFITVESPLLRCCAYYKDVVHLVGKQEGMFIMHNTAKTYALEGHWHAVTLVCAGGGLFDFDCWHIHVQ